MSKNVLSIFALPALIFIAPAFAVDGTTLINQATVVAAGGFPYNISQSGSYRLSGNLIVPTGATGGIFIGAANVTIDLNGFSITCPANNCSSGIQSTATATKIMNGVISSGTGSIGIRLSGPLATVDNMNLYANNTGIYVTGTDATIVNCGVSNNVVDGINGNSGAGTTLTILNSVISGNGGWGIEINNGLISGNTINGNNTGGTSGGIYFAGVTTMVLNNVITNTRNPGTAYAMGYAGVSRTVIGLNTIVPVNALPLPWFTSLGNNSCGVGVTC